MAGTSAYAFDNASEHAGGRFDALQTCYDPVTFARLADLGVTPGMRCLDVGGGGGSVAVWLADRVGPDGAVLVTDIEPRWLTGAEAHGTVRVVRHDITREDLPEGDFDLIHARLVLIHLPERLAALDRMVRALRPGGRLLLDEFDCAWVPVLAAPSPEAATLFETVHDALLDLLTRAGADLRWGLRTYGALRAAGLTDVASATWAGAWPGGGAGVRLHAVNVRQVRDRLVAECGVPDADIDAFLRLLDDPAFAVNSYPLISTWGDTTMRVISLVPSLTEAVAVTVPGALVGVTDWCSHPADLGGDVVRIGGTKNPKVERIVALAPDLVVANEEENREPDLAALREAGIEVLLTEVRDVPQAFRELERVVTACGASARPRWLDEAETAWSAPERWWPTAGEGRTTAVVPIWRRPWMVVGRDTFAGDVLARLGVDNAYADHAERYPRIPVEELRAAAAPGMVVLPDEPYRFTAEDGPEAFEGVPCALVSGRHLTWYGPSLAEAPRVLGEALRAAHH